MEKIHSTYCYAKAGYRRKIDFFKVNLFMILNMIINNKKA